MSEINFKKIVNPTFYTAQSTVLMLAQAGDEDAKLFYEKLAPQLKFDYGTSESDEKIFTDEEVKRYGLAIIVAIEARYKFILDRIQRDRYTNVLDLACGYTPKGYNFTKKGIDYVGVDLPVVVDTMLPLSKEVFPKGKHDYYIGGDLTNPVSIIKAAGNLNGKIGITADGILGYFNKSELEEAFKSIRSVLLEHGGAWYSSDIEMDYSMIAALGIGTDDALEKWNKQLAQTRKSSSIFLESHKFNNYNEEMKFFEANGLKVEKIPFYDESIELNSLKMLDSDTKERLLDYMKKINFWKMTAIPTENGEKAEANGSKEINNLKINYMLGKGNLKFILAGRLDTLSAPELMQVYQEIIDNNEVLKISIDMEKLDYLSSTGLRIMLMMIKKVGEGNVVVTNINEAVKSILESSGFDNLLVIE